jgi:hypothetical protein
MTANDLSHVACRDAELATLFSEATVLRPKSQS